MSHFIYTGRLIKINVCIGDLDGVHVQSAFLKICWGEIVPPTHVWLKRQYFFKMKLVAFPCSLAGACRKLDVAFSNQTHKINVMPNNRQVFLMDHSHKSVKLQRTKSIHELITNYGKKRERKPKHVTEK